MTHIQIIQEDASHDVVEVLSGLLDVAKSGQLTGLVFGISLRGQKVLVDSAGSLHRNALSGIGVAAMLMAELEHRVRRRETSTIM